MSEILEFKLDSKGRGVLPQSVREAADIATSSDLVVYAEGSGRVVIESRDAVRRRVWAAGPDTPGGDAVADVRAERRADVTRGERALERRREARADPDAGERLLAELGL